MWKSPYLALPSIIAVILTVVPTMVFGAARPVGAATNTTADAATYVQKSSPNANFASSPLLLVDNTPQTRTFMRFTVARNSAPITSVTLRLHVADVENAGSSRGGTLRSMSDATWSQDAVTWKTRPAIDGAPVGRLGAVSRNTWYEIDITRAIPGNGTFAFGLTSTSRDGVSYDSYASGANSPQLAILPVAADPVLVGAGNIASCESSGDEATASLLDDIDGTVFTTGDNAYETGSGSDFAQCYEPSWGRHKTRTRPAPGNREYWYAGAAGYYGYFGAAAGDPQKGYYSYDLGSWHVVVVNSFCAQVGCDVGSAQERWLRDDLAANTLPCTVAYWHHPLFASGAIDGEISMRPIFAALYDSNAELVLNGHEHNYERFAPQDPDGNLDVARGIREFVVGTGGVSHFGFNVIQPNSEVRNADTYGVLKLTLRSGGYDWDFVPADGTFADSGSGGCH